jgi:hypothetical protein
MSNVDRMMAVAQPRRDRDQWRLEATEALQRILNLRIDADSHGPAKAQLLKAARDLHKARNSLRAVTSDLRHGLRIEAFLSEMKRVEDDAESLSRQMVVRRTGGSRAKRVTASKARLAAELGFNLLNDYGNAPTLTRGGKYFRLTEMMIGRASGDTIERACRSHVARLRAEGFPTIAEFQRFTRQIHNGFLELPHFPSLRAERVFRECLSNALEQYEAQAQQPRNRRRSTAA